MNRFLQQEGYDLMGAAFGVYNELGHGLAEEVYQESLEMELALRSIPFSAKEALAVFYKGRKLKKTYVPDLFVSEGIIGELKAIKQLTEENEGQLLNYLRITKKKVGYLINFGFFNGLEWKRMVL